jgi:hypothetical protein
MMDFSHAALSCEIFMYICIKSGSHDIAKYLLGYYNGIGDKFTDVVQIYEDNNDTDSLLNYCKFLMDNNALNFPYLYKQVYEYGKFEGKDKLLEFLEGHMDKDVVAIIKLSV